MNIKKQNGDEAFLVLQRKELVILSNALNETLEALEDWEFPVRVGATKEEVRALQTSFTVLFS